MMELWLPIKGYEGLYEISNMGNVRSVARIEKFIRSGKETQRLKAGRVLKPISRDEYLGVCLSKGTTRKCYLIHRLVAETFIENPLNFPQVNHKDEDKFNNRVTNLEWCTAEYNDNYGSRNNNISNSMRRKKAQRMIDTKEQIEIWQGCTHCKNKSTNPNEYPCEECFAFNKYEPMTNADRIRNMTDEELAEWIHNISHDNEAEEPNVCIYDLDKEEEIVLYDSYGDLLEWLQAEVKEGAE